MAAGMKNSMVIEVGIFRAKMFSILACEALINKHVPDHRRGRYKKGEA